MNRFLQQFVGEPSDASWASARVEEETGASSFFAHKQQPSPPPAPQQPQNDAPPLTSASTGGVYDTVDLFEDSSNAKHQQGYMLHGHGQRLHEEVALAEPQYDPPTSLFPSPRNGFGDPFAKAAASSLFSHGQRPPSPRRTAPDMFGPSSEPAMTFPPPQQQHAQATSDPFGPSSAPGSSFPSRPPQQDQQSHFQQQNDPFATHTQVQSGLSFLPQQTSFQAADPFAASPALSFPSHPPPPQDSYHAAPSHQPQEPAPTSHSSGDVPASDFFSSAPASASSLFSSGPPAVPSVAGLFAAAPANQATQQHWATQSFTEETPSTAVPEAPRQETAPVHQEPPAPVEKEVPVANLPVPHEQTPPQQQFAVSAPAITPVQPPQAAPEISLIQPPRSQDRANSGYSLPPRSQSSMAPRSQSSQPPRSHKLALDDQIRLVEMYKQMAERLETEKNDLLKVLADQSDQFYRMQDYITSLEQELAAYRPPPQ